MSENANLFAIFAHFPPLNRERLGECISTFSFNSFGDLQIFLVILCRFENNSYFCKWSGKDPLQQKKRYAPNLRDENLRNFQKQGSNKQEGRMASTYSVGLYSIFLLQVFSGPSSRNWQKQSRASAMWQNEGNSKN